MIPEIKCPFCNKILEPISGLRYSMIRAECCFLIFIKEYKIIFDNWDHSLVEEMLVTERLFISSDYEYIVTKIFKNYGLGAKEFKFPKPIDLILAGKTIEQIKTTAEALILFS